MLEKKQFNEEVDLSEKQKLAIRNLRSKDFFKENHEIAKKVKGLFL